METIANTTKTLTWLEEWLMCLEFMHVHFLKRWKDVESKSGYDVCIKTYRKVMDKNLVLILTWIHLKWRLWMIHVAVKNHRRLKHAVNYMDI